MFFSQKKDLILFPTQFPLWIRLKHQLIRSMEQFPSFNESAGTSLMAMDSSALIDLIMSVPK